MSNSIERWKTNPEYIALADFLVEETKQVKSPLKFFELVRDFKKETGSTQSNSCLRDRIVSFRENVVEMADLETETKIRLMFAFSLPVDYGLLQELEKDAEVALDTYKRITEYKRKGGGLHLIRKHHNAGFKSNQKDVRILDFLAEKSKRAIHPISDQSLLKEFITKSGVSEWLQTLEKRYRKLKKQIYELSSYDMKTKISMMFVSGTKVSSYSLEEIRKEAIVEVDQYNRITKYKAKDGSLFLEGDHSNSYKRKANTAKKWQKALGNVDTNDSDEYEERQNDVEDKENYQNNLADLAKFVGEECLKTDHPLSINRLCNQYKQIKKSSESVPCLFKRVLNYRERISTIDHLDINSKVRQCFGLSVSLQPEYLEKLRKTAIVEVDEKQKIIRYEANDGSLQLQGDHSLSAKQQLGWAELRQSKSTPYVSNDSDGTENEETSSESKESDGETTTVNRKTTSAEKKTTDVGTRAKRSTLSRKRSAGESEQSSRRSTRKNGITKRFRENEDSLFDEYETRDVSERCASTNVPEMSPPQHPESHSIENSNESIRPEEVNIQDFGLDFDATILPRRSENPMNDIDMRIVEITSDTEPMNQQDNDDTKPQDLNNSHNLQGENIQNEATESTSTRPVASKETNESRFITNKAQIKICDSLLTWIETQDLSILQESKNRIEKKIEEIRRREEETENLAIAEFRTSLYYGHTVVTKSAIEDWIKREGTMNLKDFLLIFRNFLISLKMPVLEQFQHSIKNSIEDPSTQNKRVAIEKVEFAVQAILMIVAP